MVNTRGSERKSRTPDENTERENLGEENPIVIEDASANKTPEKITKKSPGVGGSKKQIKQKAGKFGCKKASASTSSQGLPLVQPKQTWKRDQKVNIWCKTKVLTVLHQKMTDSQKNKLKRSFLAKFWELPTGHFPTQLLLHVIRRRVNNNNKDVCINVCRITNADATKILDQSEGEELRGHVAAVSGADEPDGTNALKTKWGC